MDIEVGSILDGKVTGMIKCGAFVEIGAGKNGMVHISEISDAYVKEIGDALHCGQAVRVKVLSITENGRINLSIRRAQEPVIHLPNKRTASAAKVDWSQKKVEPTSFEDMLTRFKSTSDDKNFDLKRNIDGKRGTSGKRNSSK